VCAFGRNAFLSSPVAGSGLNPMSRAKPFVIGTVLGASAMFVALQYHVVRSAEGFRLVPRAPQTSLGLAYADVRGLSASQWTERPELARALMAAGKGDLISESVVESLSSAQREDGTTLDELRDLLNQAGSSVGSGRATDDADDSSESTSSGDDMFRIPFPQDARAKGPPDPFRIAGAETSAGNTAKPDPSAGSRFSAADVREGLLADSPSRSTNGTAAASTGRSSTERRSISSQAGSMSDRLFGDSTSAAALKSTPGLATTGSSSGQDDEQAADFEDITDQLEARAQQALDRAKATVRSVTPSGSGSSADQRGFVRGGGSSALPAAEPIRSTVAEDPSNNFDPFAE
jgi:hypothetical protein